MKRELAIFLAALSFYTRIPVPRYFSAYNPENFSKCVRYFPIMGWIAGTLAAIILLAFNTVFNLPIAILFSMLATILLTGAFHEDGLADVCDGFGGGWTKNKILEITKDSRLGTYGSVGLIFILLLKFLALQQLLSFRVNTLVVLLLFVTAHTLSRFTASVMIFTHKYVHLDTSKSWPVANNPKVINVYIATVFALMPLVALIVVTQHLKWLFLLLPLLLVWIFLSRYFKKWIGGYTGDCLGCIQQISEVIIYLSSIILWTFF